MTTLPHATPEPSTPCVATPIIDCEPPPLGPVACSPPLVLRRRAPHQLCPAPRVEAPAPPPPAAGVFADAALRRVLEVIDRRRPAGQLRGLLAPGLIDATIALARTPQPGGTAVLRRVGLRRADEMLSAAEVFASYTRGSRVRVIAARIELVCDRWQVVALQVG
ncbi:Rv3235 family protein [Mycobacterium sp. BMJ-28]